MHKPRSGRRPKHTQGVGLPAWFLGRRPGDPQQLLKSLVFSERQTAGVVALPPGGLAPPPGLELPEVISCADWADRSGKIPAQGVVDPSPELHKPLPAGASSPQPDLPVGFLSPPPLCDDQQEKAWRAEAETPAAPRWDEKEISLPALCSRCGS